MTEVREQAADGHEMVMQFIYETQHIDASRMADDDARTYWTARDKLRQWLVVVADEAASAPAITIRGVGLSAGGGFEKLTINGVDYSYQKLVDLLRVAQACPTGDSGALREALADMLARFKLYAGENNIHAGQHDKALIEKADAALKGEPGK